MYPTAKSGLGPDTKLIVRVAENTVNVDGSIFNVHTGHLDPQVLRLAAFDIFQVS